MDAVTGAIVAACIAAAIALAGVVLQVMFSGRDQDRQLKFQGDQDRRAIYATALAALKNTR